MSYWVNHLMSNSDIGFPIGSLADLYAELAEADQEHANVSLTHESEWSLSGFSSGLLIWENVAGEGEPQHRRNVSKEKTSELWSFLASGSIEAINRENWLQGYGS